MTNGLYGKGSPASGIAEKMTITAVPVGKVRTVNIGVCNTTDAEVPVSIAISTAINAAGIQLMDWKRFGSPLKPRQEYERTNQILAAGENVWIKADGVGITYDVRGFQGDE